MVTASALGAGTIINAIATLKGAAFGLDLRTYAQVEITDEGIVCEVADDPSVDTTLISACARLVLGRFAPESGVRITTRSEVPIASGLKSSSAAANAAVLALVRTLDVALEPIDVVRLGVQAARMARVTITGAFDDACASFFGGMVITDNELDLLLQRTEMKADVLIYVPRERVYSAHTNVARAKLLAPWVETAFVLAADGQHEKAMVLNGVLYCCALGFSAEPLLVALEAGAKAVSLSGTGPSYVALVDRSSAMEVKRAWQAMEGAVIETRVSNIGARVEAP
ncbi:MAG: shikimate kinase [Halobacteriota archaeon]